MPISPHNADKIGARHLSQIQEESDSREHSTCVLPSMLPRSGGNGGGVPGKGNPGKDEAGHQGVDDRLKQEVKKEVKQEVRRASYPAYTALQRKLDDNRSLLDELTCIEAELRESVRLDVERRQEDEFLRQQENKQLRTDLSYLRLSQRQGNSLYLNVYSILSHNISYFPHRPWVSSYFRKFPMHIYCLPVQAANQRGRRRRR
ncbi:hypothetical protein JOQ06_026100 [Pogonophryne albipinna]|uniref:Uncharacterized protein n=1 Tax=Pogonophryne albipinna TaxID=1090488 RepID=A0AAD6ADN9_9TELE|nr:hypothetical protein JOQ06_026100 [Pogonophryne albipinna]